MDSLKDRLARIKAEKAERENKEAAEAAAKERAAEIQERKSELQERQTAVEGKLDQAKVAAEGAESVLAEVSEMLEAGSLDEAEESALRDIQQEAADNIEAVHSLQTEYDQLSAEIAALESDEAEVTDAEQVQEAETVETAEEPEENEGATVETDAEAQESFSEMFGSFKQDTEELLSQLSGDAIKNRVAYDLAGMSEGDDRLFRTTSPKASEYVSQEALQDKWRLESDVKALKETWDTKITQETPRGIIREDEINAERLPEYKGGYRYALRRVDLSKDDVDRTLVEEWGIAEEKVEDAKRQIRQDRTELFTSYTGKSPELYAAEVGADVKSILETEQWSDGAEQEQKAAWKQREGELKSQRQAEIQNLKDSSAERYAQALQQAEQSEQYLADKDLMDRFNDEHQETIEKLRELAAEQANDSEDSSTAA